MLRGDAQRILGVTEFSTLDNIQDAYRKLAKAYHPDLNPGDKIAEEKFKELEAAYSILRPIILRKDVMKQFKKASKRTGIGKGSW